MNLLFPLRLFLRCLVVLLVRFRQRLHWVLFLDLPQQLFVPCNVRLPSTLVLGFTTLLWTLFINVRLLVHGIAVVPIFYFDIPLASS